jgi:hypothetical protein
MTSAPSELSTAGGAIAVVARAIAVVARAIALFSLVLLVPIILIVAKSFEPDQRGLRPA